MTYPARNFFLTFWLTLMTTVLHPYRIYKDKLGREPIISLLDFNDSFTFNIATYLGLLGYSFQVIPFCRISSFLKSPFLFNNVHILVYGPGPGHPDEYSNLFSSIKELLSCNRLFHVGICLGHQIMGRIFGDDVALSKNPIHAQTVSLKIPSWESCFPKETWGRNILVQRYNSLSIKKQKIKNSFKEILDENDEVLMRLFERGVSYQFHPESIGTSFPSLFFEPLKYFLYNFNYEESDSVGWNL